MLLPLHLSHWISWFLNSSLIRGHNDHKDSSKCPPCQTHYVGAKKLDIFIAKSEIRSNKPLPITVFAHCALLSFCENHFLQVWRQRESNGHKFLVCDDKYGIKRWIHNSTHAYKKSASCLSSLKYSQAVYLFEKYYPYKQQPNVCLLRNKSET